MKPFVSSTDTDITSTFAARLRAHRRGLHLSQVEAAERLGVSVRTVQKWESGSAYPRPTFREAIHGFFEAAA